MVKQQANGPVYHNPDGHYKEINVLVCTLKSTKAFPGTHNGTAAFGCSNVQEPSINTMLVRFTSLFSTMK